MKMFKFNRILLNLVIGVFVFAVFTVARGAVSDEVFAADKYVSAYFTNTESVPLTVKFIYYYGSCLNTPNPPDSLTCKRIADPGGQNTGFLPASNGSSYNFVSAYPDLSNGENPDYYV